ncbi:helix-turn-helix domain-containing protein [Saccharothrix sp.]|uniref:helix-turn-helix transcriptional regulator n=1 Tax=Saccharothrix sp. TaxID=1873460 RepID=UPI0028128022|nr:helix-turn-helix domain-containing protein [Saccharothrix sp.]
MVEIPHDPVAAVAALDEPTRRRLYDYVVRRPGPVGRDEAAAAVGAPRTTVAFHLDRLVDEGLLEAVHERRTGRTGPGAGRPAKLYRRAPHPIAVSLPENRYELIGALLADAVAESDTTGEPPRAVLHRRARELGRGLGRSGGDPVAALEGLGFEPRAEGDSVVLGNCPFHSLAQRHTELVCGANLCLLEGLVSGLGADLRARLDPSPGHCCVRLEP